jgi:hypothetical protein
MKRSLHRRLGQVAARLPDPAQTAWEEAAHLYLTGRGPLPEGEEWLRVARCVRERWHGTRQPGEYLEGMTEEQCRRVEQIIDEFRGWGWPPDGWDGKTFPDG